MLLTEKEGRAERALKLLPGAVCEEIIRLLRARRGGIGALSEVRIRAGGLCSVLVGEENVILYNTVTPSEMEEVVRRLTDGALYTYRDSISSGFVTLEGGIRVGLCGLARYEYKSVVGVTDMRSLVFRFPRGECAFTEELHEIWRRGVGAGMLIYSPPGVGKTTALRALAGAVGRGEGARRVCVVDERCEFCEEDYRDAQVDILKGYRRKSGLEIATRTMSAEVVMIDELGADDAGSILQAVRCGIPLVATAHAASFEEIKKKASLSPLLECGAFEVFVGIRRSGGKYTLTEDRL